MKLTNPYWWQDRLKYLPLIQRAFLFYSLSNKFPSALNIEVTNACNLDCSFCPRKLSGRKIGFMSEPLYKKIIDEVAGEKKLQVLWLMKDGESLLHPEICEMVSYAAKKKAAKRIEIYTNGTLLDEEMGRGLIKAHLNVLTVSIDAVDRKEFEKLKGVDAYEEVVRNTKRFIELKKKMGSKKPMVAVKMVEMKENASGIDRFRKMWGGIADSVIIQKLHSWEGSMEEIFNFQFSIFKSPRRYPCNLPWLNPAIFWDGKVTTCCVNFRENELVMGDLGYQSLREIWRGEKFKRLRRAHLEQNFNQFPTCAHCQYWRQLPDMSFWLRRLGV